MKYLFHVCLFVVVLRISAAYWINQDGYMSYPEEDSDDALGAISSVKRSTPIISNEMSIETTTYKPCMRWGMVCVPGSKLRFTKCCGGLNCVCNIWNSHCKCRVKLG